MTLMSDAVKTVDVVTRNLQMQAQDGQKVTLFVWAGDGGVGAPVYNSGKKYNAVVENKQRLVRGADGQEITSSTSVLFLVPTIIVKPKDAIQLYGEDFKREVLAVSGPVDASGMLIRECYLG